MYGYGYLCDGITDSFGRPAASLTQVSLFLCYSKFMAPSDADASNVPLTYPVDVSISDQSPVGRDSSFLRSGDQMEWSAICLYNLPVVVSNFLPISTSGETVVRPISNVGPSTIKRLGSKYITVCSFPSTGGQRTHLDFSCMEIMSGPDAAVSKSLSSEVVPTFAGSTIDHSLPDECALLPFLLTLEGSVMA